LIMQLMMNLGALSGTETVTPYAVGDILETKPFGRVVIETVDENIHGQVFLCVSLVDGRSCVVLPKEITYRSR
jgi:hypothetical protein